MIDALRILCLAVLALCVGFTVFLAALVFSFRSMFKDFRK